MFDLSSLFGLTPRDLQITPLQILRFQTNLNNGTTTSFSHEYQVPFDRVLVLNSYVARVHRGGAATITESYVSFGTFDAQNPYFVSYSNNAGVQLHLHGNVSGVNATGTFQWIQPMHGNWVLGPGEKVFCQATFSATNPSNGIELAVHGVLIPRGNIAF